MRKLLTIIPSCVSIGTAGVGLFGFIEVSWYGKPVMIAGEPIDPLLMKSVYLFLIFIGATAAVLLVIGYICRSIKHYGNIAIRELEEMQRCGEAMVDWASVQKPSLQSAPPAKIRLRYLTLMKKYRGWVIELPGQNSVGDSVLLAANISETLRAYGYVRGRFRIWCERRTLKRTIADQSQSQQREADS